MLLALALNIFYVEKVHFERERWDGCRDEKIKPSMGFLNTHCDILCCQLHVLASAQPNTNKQTKNCDLKGASLYNQAVPSLTLLSHHKAPPSTWWLMKNSE